jgi:glycerol-3-phosphate dehydrogenase
VVDAAERGAVVRTRTRCVRVERGAEWKLVLEVRGRRDVMTARALINATGPWVGPFSETVLQKPSPGNIRLIAGSHIVVPRLFDHDRAYIFQAPDGRVVFAIPFEGDFTMVGTTDHDFSGDPAKVEASAEEIGYLCKVATDHFRTAVFPADVIWSFAGVRPLYDEQGDDPEEKPQDTPRDYVLALDRVAGEAPLLTVYGGKITTYRRLAEEAYGKLAPLFGARRDWTRGTSLPGGDFDVAGIEQLIAGLRLSFPFLSEGNARRLARAYGTRVRHILGSAKSLDDLGPSFGAELTGAEVRYLMAHEWAQMPDDVLWRRTKLGLRISRDERARLSSFMTNVLGNTASGGADR